MILVDFFVSIIGLTENNNSKDIANDGDLLEKVSKIFGVQVIISEILTFAAKTLHFHLFIL
jgi:hypothetical protein